MPPLPDHACEVTQGKGASACPPACLEEADLIKKLSSLETRVATLQEHLAQLALEVLHERELRYERRITALEAAVQQNVGMPASPQAFPDPPATLAGKEWPDVSHHKRPLHPAEQRARSRMPPLIEYTTQGSYVIISSLEGELHFVPDSSEWFDWLASLASFRFVGKLGRFTAYRESSRRDPTRSWRAHRCIHNRHYKYHLGVTDYLTIEHLEQAAASLQAHMAALSFGFASPCARLPVSADKCNCSDTARIGQAAYESMSCLLGRLQSSFAHSWLSVTKFIVLIKNRGYTIFRKDVFQYKL